MREENLNKKFEEEFDKLSEKDKKEVNNLIRFMQEKKYHDSQYEELLKQYIELSRDYDKLENIIKEVREILKFHLSNPSGTKNGWHIDIWNSEDISKLNEDLGILDKENK